MGWEWETDEGQVCGTGAGQMYSCDPDGDYPYYQYYYYDDDY